MAKILYVMSDLRIVGPTKQTFNIIKNSIYKNESVVVTLFDEPSDTYIDEYLKHDIKIKCLGLNRKLFFINGINKLNKIINEVQPDIVHSYGVIADVLTTKSAKINDIKHIITLRNYPKEDILSRMNFVEGHLALKAHLSVLKKCKYLVCCSKTIYQKMKNDYPSLNVTYIQNGVDISKFMPLSDEEKSKQKEELGYKEYNIFISTGSFIKRKRIDETINIFNEINEENKLLVLLGDGDLFNDLKKRYKSQNIVFLGKKENIVDYLQISDYFISSSESEGLPNSVIEAISCNVPVILSNIPQHLEIKDEVGNVGIFYELGNINNAVKQYRKINSCEYSEFKNNTKKIKNSNLTMTKMSQNYCNYYKEIGE